MYCKDRETPEFYNSRGVFGQKITPAVTAEVIKTKKIVLGGRFISRITIL